MEVVSSPIQHAPCISWWGAPATGIGSGPSCQASDLPI